MIPIQDCGIYKVIDTSERPFEIRKLKPEELFSVVSGETHIYESLINNDIHMFGALSKLFFSNYQLPGVEYGKTLEAALWHQMIIGAMYLGNLREQKVFVNIGEMGGNSKGNIDHYLPKYPLKLLYYLKDYLSRFNLNTRARVVIGLYTTGTI